MQQPALHRTAVRRQPGIGTPTVLAVLAIVEDLDVFSDLPDGLFPCLVATVMDKLIFERTPEALHGSIIIAIAFSAHRYKGRPKM